MKIVVGTASFGLKYGAQKKRVNRHQINLIDKILKKNSINFLDTAMSYGNSEKVIGNMKSKKNVITKIILPKKKIKNLSIWFEKKLKLSLHNLKLEQLYGLLIHDTKDIFSQKQLLTCCLNAKKKGYVKYIGISVYETNEIKKVMKIWKPEIIQFPANIFDQRFIKNNILNTLKKKKIKIFVRSCFLQGRLLKENIKYKDNLYFRKFYNWCREKKISQLKACIDFIRNIKKIDFLIIGIDDSYNLSEICKVLKLKSKKIPYYFKCNNKKIIDPRRW